MPDVTREELDRWEMAAYNSLPFSPETLRRLIAAARRVLELEEARVKWEWVYRFPPSLEGFRLAATARIDEQNATLDAQGQEIPRLHAEIASRKRVETRLREELLFARHRLTMVDRPEAPWFKGIDAALAYTGEEEKHESK